MCGIVGYIGKRDALGILMDGLHRLEYRGYDSAGVAVVDGDLTVTRASGKIAELEKKVSQITHHGTTGIAHTRWATHGPPVEKNAHPHRDCSGRLAIVHNGIIENHAELRRDLQAKGHVISSETDSEILAHLIENEMKTQGDLSTALRFAVRRVRGTYGVAVVSMDEPGTICVARLGSPIVIGVGDGEMFVASDASAIMRYTTRVIYLDDGEMATLEAGNYRIRSLDNLPVAKEITEIEWSEEDVQKNGQPHFMLKEMLEQSEVLRNTMRGRLDADNGTAILGGLKDASERLRELDRITIVACGSAYYAGLVGKYMLEEYAGISVTVELASEFRYRKPVLTNTTAVIAVSQSGETADTLAAVKEAKMKGILTLGIVNTVGSTIARETDFGVYNHAGPEIGVASTKAFISQCVVFALLTLFLGRQRQLSLVMGKRIVEELKRLPELVDRILDGRELVRDVAEKYSDVTSMIFLGRKYCSPIAYEGALKLKEITYIHAEGYAAGEMKHGPIALVCPELPSVVLCPKDSVYEKTKSNIEELRARGGKIIAVTTEENDEVHEFAEDVIEIPKTLEMLTPILAVIPLQFFSYYTSVKKGIDPDKPRNLAKSVTVE
ncbi:MAG: glutamine--fructose-6-phosphate transaminase (isomerizing) [bacterium]|nr:glutamine--fructose-6-phosphate transaminase (isomerizing) [bacterium]